MTKTMTPKKVLSIANPPGGVGKTFLAQAVEAIAKALFRDIYLASQDRGNHAIKKVIEDALVLPANVTEADVIRVANRVADREIFVIDVGANPATETYNPVPFYVALAQHVQREGGRFIVAVPVAPLKEGVIEATNNTVQAFVNEGIETHIVRNHQNRSGEFDGLKVPPGVLVSDLPKLDDGLVALLRRRGGSFLDAYHNAEPEYRLAGNRIGQWLVDASRSPLMQMVFGYSGSAFKLPAQDVPPPIHNPIETLASVSDDALQLNYDRFAARQAFMAADDETAFLTAARLYRELLKRR